MHRPPNSIHQQTVTAPDKPWCLASKVNATPRVSIDVSEHDSDLCIVRNDNQAPVDSVSDSSEKLPGLPALSPQFRAVTKLGREHVENFASEANLYDGIFTDVSI
jgi:hypothetical protein